VSTADVYRAYAAGFNRRVEAVPNDQWDSASPCDEWKARDVVRHVVDTSTMFLGFVGEQLHAPSPDDDPVKAWHTARDAIQSALDDPGIAQREYDGMFGNQTFEEGVGRFLAPDLIVHTWDLARATGGDEQLDEDACRTILRELSPMDEAMRQPGGFAPKIDPPQANDPQTQLLNFAGRRV
jgi:uncharacterized protein (TIGR03086 family)